MVTCTLLFGSQPLWPGVTPSASFAPTGRFPIDFVISGPWVLPLTSDWKPYWIFKVVLQCMLKIVLPCCCGSILAHLAPLVVCCYPFRAHERFREIILQQNSVDVIDWTTNPCGHFYQLNGRNGVFFAHSRYSVNIFSSPERVLCFDSGPRISRTLSLLGHF